MPNTTNQNIVGGTLNSIGYQFLNSELTSNEFLVKIGKEILSSSSMINKFCDQLVNRIGKTYIKSNYYENDLACFKKEKIPNGVAIQDVFINSFEPTDFDTMDGSQLLANDGQQDIISVYYTVNQQKKYRVISNRPEIQKAFVNWNEMESFISNIINQLFTSQQIYEWNCTKALLGTDFLEPVSCAKDKEIVYFEETFSTDFVKQCRALYNSFKQPDFTNNNFIEYAKSKNIQNISKNPITTLSKPDEINLIVKNDILTDVEVDVLAVSFNMEKSKLLGKIKNVNNFGLTKTQIENGRTHKYVYSMYDNEENEIPYYDLTDYTYVDTTDNKTYNIKLVAVMCDDSFIHLSDMLDPMTSSFFNPDNLSLKTYLHTMQRFGLCPFANSMYLYTKTEVKE